MTLYKRTKGLSLLPHATPRSKALTMIAEYFTLQNARYGLLFCIIALAGAIRWISTTRRGVLPPGPAGFLKSVPQYVLAF